MITITLTPKTRAFALKSALNALRKGGVIAFATETVYGIGCDPRDAKAVRRVFAMKGREEKKPLQIIAGSMAQVMRVADLHPRERAVASKYWPGPFTLIVHHKKKIRLAPRTSAKQTIGIRVTPDRFLRDLINAFGFPIAATSANRSGGKPATSGRGVRNTLKGVRASGREGVNPHALTPLRPYAPDLLIDAGALPRRKPTTVARISEDGRVEIVRRGGVRIRA